MMYRVLACVAFRTSILVASCIELPPCSLLSPRAALFVGDITGIQAWYDPGRSGSGRIRVRVVEDLYGTPPKPEVQIVVPGGECGTDLSGLLAERYFIAA